MAGGRGIIGSDGKLLIRSDGTVDICGECCNVYSRWHKCGSETGEIYTRDSDSAPNPFLYGGTCWSRVSTGQALPGGATLLDPADWTTDAGCCVCSGCGDYPTPSTWQLTFSGVTNCCVNSGSPPSQRVADNLNGTYSVSRVSACVWTASFSVNINRYDQANCAGGVTGDTSTGMVQLAFTGGIMLVTVGVGYSGFNGWFEGRGSVDCTSNQNLSAQWNCGITVAGGGGSVLVEPGA